MHARYEVSIPYDSKGMFKIKVKQICRSKVTVKITRSNFWHDHKDLIIKNVHVKYKSSTSNGSIVMVKFKVFRNEGQKLQSKSLGNRTRSHLNRFYKLILHAKYQVFISYGSNITAKVKFCRYVGQSSRSRSLG